jgi:methionyl-tRNA synthetase
MAAPYLITTAISYPNGKPHMGHAYEAVTTDVIARFHRLLGRDVRFLTGTDEHGLKIAQAAKAAGLPPKQYVDIMVEAFADMTAKLQISHDRFMRTTDADNVAAAQELWRRMAANGDLYPGRYEGWYSVRDEAYYDEAELLNATDASGQVVRLSPQGTPVEWTVEESWFFRLSAYQDRLLALYDEQPDFVRPARSRNEMRAFVAGGLNDLSMSRTSFDWGVPVPDAPGHVMYVWVDALVNYLTGAGWPEDERRWPADLHIIGKDVVRFHAVYWPAFLIAAGVALPKAVFGHGHVLNRGEKMSKSLGNVVDPLVLAEAFGVDRLRWFLVREVAFGDDGSYSDAGIAERANADLANGIGNLAQRALAMVAKDGGAMPAAADGEGVELATALAAHTEAYFENMHGLALHRALESVMAMVSDANGFFAEAAPWGLKDDPVRRAAVLAATLDAARRIALLVQPVIPTSAGRLLDQLGVAPEARQFADLGVRVAAGTPLPAPSGVFPRWVEPAA